MNMYISSGRKYYFSAIFLDLRPKTAFPRDLYSNFTRFMTGFTWNSVVFDFPPKFLTEYTFDSNPWSFSFGKKGNGCIKKIYTNDFSITVLCIHFFRLALVEFIQYLTKHDFHWKLNFQLVAAGEAMAFYISALWCRQCDESNKKENDDWEKGFCE